MHQLNATLLNKIDLKNIYILLHKLSYKFISVTVRLYPIHNTFETKKKEFTQYFHMLQHQEHKTRKIFENIINVSAISTLSVEKPADSY